MEHTITGLEDFGRDDIVITRRAMVQPTSRDKKDEHGEDIVPGMFYDESTKQVIGKSMSVVVLKIQKSRALFWPMDDKEHRGLRCWSSDSKFPAGRVEDPVSAECANCEFKSKDIQYDMLCMSVDESRELSSPVVFWLRSKGSSNFPTCTFISAMVQRKKALRDFSVVISTTKPPSKKGSFFVYQFSNIRPVEDDQELADLVSEAFQLYIDTPVEAEDTVDVETTDADGIPF
jgi:hypothetical protein